MQIVCNELTEPLTAHNNYTIVFEPEPQISPIGMNEWQNFVLLFKILDMSTIQYNIQRVAVWWFS